MGGIISYGTIWFDGMINSLSKNGGIISDALLRLESLMDPNSEENCPTPRKSPRGWRIARARILQGRGVGGISSTDPCFMSRTLRLCIMRHAFFGSLRDRIR